MYRLDRRHFITSGIALLGAGPALAQHAGHAGHGQYEKLTEPGRIARPELAAVQAVFDSPAPKAAQQGRWSAKADLPLPRSEMAWATAHEGKMHIVGGYGEQRVDRPYHHVYDAASDRWTVAAQLPSGANHVGVAFLDGKLYAIGGFIEQNRKPHPNCFVWDAQPMAGKPSRRCRGRSVRPRSSPSTASSTAIGGAIGDTFDTKKSVDWHLVYDPKADKWDNRTPMPTARDHTGTLAVGNLIHVVGGRVDSFQTNSNLHHIYDPARDKWEARNPLPTARSGHGAVLYRGKIFVMGGEGSSRVFAQNEAYDPVKRLLGAICADADAAPWPRRSDSRRCDLCRRRRRGDGRQHTKRHQREFYAGLIRPARRLTA